MLGSGLSGLATALAAHRLGLKTLVLEKASLIGGGTCHSSGLVWVGCNHLARAAGIADRPEWVRDYMQFLGGGQQDANMAAFIGEAPRALAFFERCGIAFDLVQGMADHHLPSRAGRARPRPGLGDHADRGRELGAWSDRLVRPGPRPMSSPPKSWSPRARATGPPAFSTRADSTTSAAWASAWSCTS